MKLRLGTSYFSCVACDWLQAKLSSDCYKHLLVHKVFVRAQTDTMSCKATYGNIHMAGLDTTSLRKSIFLLDYTPMQSALTTCIPGSKAQFSQAIHRCNWPQFER